MNTFVSLFYFKCGRYIEVSDDLCVFPSCKDKHSPTVMNVYKEVLIVDWFLFDFFTRRYIFNFLPGRSAGLM